MKLVEMAAKGAFLTRLRSTFIRIFSSRISYLFVVGKHGGNGGNRKIPGVSGCPLPDRQF